MGTMNYCLLTLVLESALSVNKMEKLNIFETRFVYFL